MMKGMIFAERYQLEDFIGQGGMSLVYRAVDIRTGHSVAVKILKSEYNSDKEFLERFQREAQAASLMSHHNIVNLLDVGVEGEYRYLVLEYVSGSTLKDVIRQKGRLNTTTAIQITVRILSALQHAHDNGIMHLPQLAAMGDANFYIEKHEEDGVVSTHLHRIEAEALEQEIARLSGGLQSAVSRQHARELLSNAQNLKRAMEDF